MPLDAGARDGQRTEVFPQVMLMLSQTVSLTDLELTCNQLADLQGQAFVHLLSSGLHAHFSPGCEDSTQVLTVLRQAFYRLSYLPHSGFVVLR